MLRINAAQGESTIIVLMYLNGDVRYEVMVKTYCSTEVMDEGNKGQQIFESLAEYHIFSLHGGECKFH